MLQYVRAAFSNEKWLGRFRVAPLERHERIVILNIIVNEILTYNTCHKSAENERIRASGSCSGGHGRGLSPHGLEIKIHLVNLLPDMTTFQGAHNARGHDVQRQTGGGGVEEQGEGHHCHDPDHLLLHLLLWSHRSILWREVLLLEEEEHTEQNRQQIDTGDMPEQELMPMCFRIRLQNLPAGKMS